MAWVKVQGKAKEEYEAYLTKDTIVVDPYGNETPVDSTGKKADQIEAEIQGLVEKWDRNGVYARKNLPDGHPDKLATAMRVGIPPPKGKGYIAAVQYDSYDVGFTIDEVADPARAKIAMDTVKAWANQCNLPGSVGKRLYTYQDWHRDGTNGIPHIRIQVNRVLYDPNDKNAALKQMAYGGHDGHKTTDLDMLMTSLADAGFSVQKAVSLGENGEVLKQATAYNKDTLADEVDQDLQERGIETPAPRIAPAARDWTVADPGRSDVLSARRAEVLARMASARAELERIEDAQANEIQIGKLTKERIELNQNIKNLTHDVTEKTASIDGFAETVKADLAVLAPDFAQATAELPATEVVQAGLAKHVEIETNLTTELTNTQQELAQITTAKDTLEQEVINASLAVSAPFDNADAADIQGKDLPEKITSLHTKYASQLKAAEDEWLIEIKAKDEVIDATQTELNTTKESITEAVDVLRAFNPDLFKGNPDLEKSLRSVMQAAVAATKIEQEKVVEVEAKNDALEEQNDALAKKTQALTTENERLAEEKTKAEQALKDIQAQLDEQSKKVQELTNAEDTIRRIIKPKIRDIEGFESATLDEAVTSLTEKYDTVVKERDVANSQVEMLKEDREMLRTQVSELGAKLDAQVVRHEEQMTAMRAEFKSEIAQVSQGQAGRGSGPTQGTGAAVQRTSPAQGTPPGGPKKKGPEIPE